MHIVTPTPVHAWSLSAVLPVYLRAGYTYWEEGGGIYRVVRREATMVGR